MGQRSFWGRGGGSLLSALAVLVTTLCCLGLPALVGLLSALGAGFLLTDRYLEPLLAGTLLFTLVVDGLHLRRHHQPGPFLLSLVAAGSVYFAIWHRIAPPRVVRRSYGRWHGCHTHLEPVSGLWSHPGSPGHASLGPLALPPVCAQGRTCSHA